MGEIKKKRVYDSWENTDGYRVLVDRLWPRGVSKDKALLDEWAKTLAPSGELRKAYHENIVGWEEFASLYGDEIRNNKDFQSWSDSLKDQLKNGNVTLLTAAKLEPHSHVDIIENAILARIGNI